MDEVSLGSSYVSIWTGTIIMLFIYNAAKNINVQVFSRHVYNYHGYISESGNARSYGNSV